MAAWTAANALSIQCSKVRALAADWIASPLGECSERLSLALARGQPVLLGLHAAAHGRAIENWGDARIVAAAMVRLGGVFGAEIPHP